MAVSVAPWLQIRMVVVVILYLYRNMIVCNSSLELFQSKKHLMLQWKLHWKEGDDACMLCMVWQWLVHILLRKCWIQFYYTIVSNLALFASAFRCLLTEGQVYLDLNVSNSVSIVTAVIKIDTKKIEPHNVWWCFKSCRKVLNIIKISYVGREIQCTPKKS